MWEQLAGVLLSILSAWCALSIQGWLRGEHSSLLLPKPQQMTTFRSVISLSSTAGQAIHFSTIKGQRSLCRPRCLCTAVEKQRQRARDALQGCSSVRAEQAWASLTSPIIRGDMNVSLNPCAEELP